jgi:hypothetical protein
MVAVVMDISSLPRGMQAQVGSRVCRAGGPGGFPVGEGHEVAVGCAGGVEFVGSFLELLAQSS